MKFLYSRKDITRTTAAIAEERTRIYRIPVGVVAVHLEQDLPVAGRAVLEKRQRARREAFQFLTAYGHDPGGSEGSRSLAWFAVARRAL